MTPQRKNITESHAFARFAELVQAGTWRSWRDSIAVLSGHYVDARTAHELSPGFVGFCRAEFCQHTRTLPEFLREGPDGASFFPPPEVRARARVSTNARAAYLLHDLDMRENFGAAIEVLQRFDVHATRADISSELADYILRRLKARDPADIDLAAYFPDVRPPAPPSPAPNAPRRPRTVDGRATTTSPR